MKVICPVCGGLRHVRVFEGHSTAPVIETCAGCGGTGVQDDHEIGELRKRIQELEAENDKLRRERR